MLIICLLCVYIKNDMINIIIIVIGYPELEEKHKNPQIQLLDLYRTTPGICA